MIIGESRVQGSIIIGGEEYKFNITKPEKSFRLRVRGWKFITIRSIYFKVLSFENQIYCVYT